MADRDLMYGLTICLSAASFGASILLVQTQHLCWLALSVPVAVFFLLCGDSDG